ncbi:MAG: hypothetical protein LUD81_07950 [Clostridiales bacterium]|nr:hypothetical protein [Clostridiales bacterium]
MLEKIDELILALADRNIHNVNSADEDFSLSKGILSEIDALTRLIEARNSIGELKPSKDVSVLLEAEGL